MIKRDSNQNGSINAYNDTDACCCSYYGAYNCYCCSVFVFCYDYEYDLKYHYYGGYCQITVMIVIMHDNCAYDCWFFDCYCYSYSCDYQECDNILTFWIVLIMIMIITIVTTTFIKCWYEDEYAYASLHLKP